MLTTFARPLWTLGLPRQGAPPALPPVAIVDRGLFVQEDTADVLAVPHVLVALVDVL
jgi:hypothetical protein